MLFIEASTEVKNFGLITSRLSVNSSIVLFTYEKAKQNYEAKIFYFKLFKKTKNRNITLHKNEQMKKLTSD